MAIGAGSHSGRSLRLASLTAHQASDEIIEKGRRIASHLLEAAEAGIDFADGYFTVAGTDRSLDLFAVAVAARDDASLPAELRGPLAGIGEVTSQVASFPHGFHVSEVEIDPDTGAVEIVRYTAVDDVGRSEGGITPALGAIVNAIVDAMADLGVTHLEMPVTPERVWRAIRTKPGE